MRNSSSESTDSAKNEISDSALEAISMGLNGYCLALQRITAHIWKISTAAGRAVSYIIGLWLAQQEMSLF